MSASSKFAFVSAKWSKDVGAYVATIDGKVVIIEIEGKEPSVTVAKAAVVAGDAPKEKATRKAKSRLRAKRLTPEESAKATELIRAGKSHAEVQAEVPGVVKNIFVRLKRLAAKSSAKKVAAKKPAVKQAVKKVAAKKPAAAKV